MLLCRLYLVDFVSIECSNFPALNVRHQFLLGVSVPPELLQVLSIPLGQHKRRDGEAGGLHFYLLFKHLSHSSLVHDSVIQVVVATVMKSEPLSVSQ